MKDTVFRVNMRMGDFVSYNKNLADTKFNRHAYNEYLTNKTERKKKKKLWHRAESKGSLHDDQVQA